MRESIVSNLQQWRWSAAKFSAKEQDENVSIVFIFPVRVDPQTLKRIESPTFSGKDFPVQQHQKVLPAYREIPFGGDGIEIVTINWTNRKCRT
jgi:hypothetical protein